MVLQNYDAIGRVCAIGASGSTCTAGTRYLNSPTYNAAGEALSVTFGNSVQGAFTYNDHLQLATLRYFKGTSEILNLGYDYTTGVPGNNGQIQKMHYYTTPGVEDQTKSENFTYDILRRLSAAQTGVVNSTSGAKTWSLQWTYDRLGNRLTQTMVGGDPTLPVSQPNFTIDPATNRITNSGYTYDAAGNMTHDANAAYAYDGANRMININTSAAVYSYFGPQRIKKVLGSTTTRYIYSGRKPIAEYVGTTSPTLSAEYIYAGSKLLVTIAGSSTTYHHPDSLSNRAETNSSGTRTTFGHLPYGDTWYETTPTDKWKFTSYERDSGTGETGLDYANFRYYASGQGRFMSADLMSGQLNLPRSLNRYAYVGNDPINLSDPLGLFWFETTACVTTDSGTTCETFYDWFDLGEGGGGDTADQKKKNCEKGLKLANTDSNAVDRANEIWDTLQNAADANNVDPALLAAITVRETGARNIPENGGGLGRGYFQIDLGAHPNVSEAQAYDPTFAANYAAKLLDSNMDKLSAAHPNFNPTQLLQATAASYNFGTGNISGNPNTIDVGTTGNN